MNTPALSKEELIRNEVIQAARRLFQRYGMVKTTMEDIAREMGRGKSTLYYYFKSKDEIFDAVVTREMEEALDIIEAATKNCILATDKISAFIHTTSETLKSKANLYTIVKGEIRDNPQLMAKLKTTLDAKEMFMVKSIIMYGLDTGEFKPAIAQEADLLSFLMVSTLRSLSLDLLTSEKPRDLEDVFRLLTDLLLHGIRKK